MNKLTHRYINKGDFPLNSVAFIIEKDGKKYGHYEIGFPPEDKFRILRGLVLTKQGLGKDLMLVTKYKQTCRC